MWALSTDPVPGKGCQGHGESAKAMGGQPGNEVQQLELHAVAAGRLYQGSCGLQVPVGSVPRVNSPWKSKKEQNKADDDRKQAEEDEKEEKEGGKKKAGERFCQALASPLITCANHDTLVMSACHQDRLSCSRRRASVHMLHNRVQQHGKPKCTDHNLVDMIKKDPKHMLVYTVLDNVHEGIPCFFQQDSDLILGEG